MNKSKFDKLIAWLQEPSTIKAIILFASLGGVGIEPELMNEFLVSGAILYGGVAAFLDKN